LENCTGHPGVIFEALDSQVSGLDFIAASDVDLDFG
jgi:hypothetical protein